VIPSLHQVPGIVQAEDYNTGGEGVGYHDSTPTNLGDAYRADGVDIESISNGYTLCYIRDEEWTRYTLNVTASGVYRVDLLVSCPGVGHSVSLFENETELGTVQIPLTGSFDTYAHGTVEVPLSAGLSVLTLRFNGDGQNFDSFSLTRVEPAILPDQATAPLDADHDGLYEDLNGNGHLDFSDVALLFNQMDWIDQQDQWRYYDFNGNGRLDFDDVVLLFGRL
jgi:PKD repeat protein